MRAEMGRAITAMLVCSAADPRSELHRKFIFISRALNTETRHATERIGMDKVPGEPHSNATHTPATAAGDPASEMLKTSKTIAIVGLSSRRHRPSYGVAEYLKSVGYRVIPVNPSETEVLGEKAYARLEDIPEHVDIVDIFRRSEFVPEIVESAIRIGARGVWMQEGVIHPDAAERARRAGLLVVMNTCILKEHIKRFRLQ